MTQHPKNRREFFETTAAAALAGSLIANADAAAEDRSVPRVPKVPKIPRKRIAIITTLWASFRQALSDENQPG